MSASLTRLQSAVMLGETLINVILSEAKDQIARDDGCKSLKSLCAR